MNYLKFHIKVLIQEEVNKIFGGLLREQEENTSGGLDLDLGGESLGSDMEDVSSGGAGEDLGMGLDADTGDLGGEGGGGLGMGLDSGEEGEANGGEESDDEFGLGGDDFGSDFGGGFGGGGGGSDLGGFGDDDTGGEDAGAESSDETEPGETIPDDPVQGVVDDVKKALDSTTDPQRLLNVAKSSLQKYFTDFSEAGDVISKLEQDKDPLIKSVGQRLSMFIRGF